MTSESDNRIRVADTPTDRAWLERRYKEALAGLEEEPKAELDYVTAELIKAGDEYCACWVEVAEGLRIQTSLPTDRLRHLNLREGEEFLWSPWDNQAARIPEEPDSPEREELRKRIIELQREFHEELKDIVPTLRGSHD